MRDDNGKPAAPPSEDGLAQALEDYLEAAEAGTAPPREEFLARHPELAEQLDGCLAALRLIGRAARGPLSAVGGGDGLPLVGPDGEPVSGVLGDYRIVREVGRGGMGVVYEAEQVSLGRRVALKVLPFAATMDPRQLQRFQNEARAAASLDHPHIVHVHAVGCERAVHFYAMQFIDGQTLAAMIAELRGVGGRPLSTEEQPTTPHVPGQPAPPAVETAARAAASTERVRLDRAHFRRVAEWGIQAAEALDHAHQLGIVHRDIKPANLLVDARGGLWVTDFGLAHIQSDARLTMTGDLVGTLRYMSPEQALAKRVVIDHRTDVYSLGATLYELLTLEPAFKGADRQELLRQIAFEEPRAPRRVIKAIPPELETIVLKAMEKNPQERYATAKELAEDLRRYLADEPIRARRAGVVRRLRKWSRRHRVLVGAIAVALLLAAVLGSGNALWWTWKRDRAEREARASLREAIQFQGQERWPEALSAARQAEGVLAGLWADRGLREQVHELIADLEMARRLQEAELRRTRVKDEHFDDEGADAAYAAAFQEYGLDVDGLDAQTVAERIRARSIRRRLVEALDDWAIARKGQQAEGWEHLLAVARAADPDELRNRLRGFLERKDPNAVEDLTAASPTDGWPEQTVVLLGKLAWVSKAASADRVALTLLMTRAQQQHPDDFWINETLGMLLANSGPEQLDERLRFQSVAVALQPKSPGAHLNLGAALYKKGRMDEAIAEFRKASDLDPKYAEARNGIGLALFDKGDLDGAVAEFRTAIALDPRGALAHNNLALIHDNLGAALHKKGRLDEAIAEFREAIRIKMDHPGVHYNLGVALWDKGRLDEAIAECREAIRLKPDLAEAHYNLGIDLWGKGRLDEAIAEYREAIRLKPDYAEAHTNLGNALRDKGRLDEAIAEHREAIRLKPDYAVAHMNLAIALHDKGRPDEAIAEYREAIRIKPDYAEAHSNLGVALRDKGRLDEASAEFREVTRINKDDPLAHLKLGMALQEEGKYAEALSHLRRAHELGSKNPRWPYPSAQWVKECERLVELDAKLPRVLKGEVQPANVGERLTLAQICQLHKSLNAASVRFYTEAFAEQPKLADDMQGQPRYNAACAAAQAGCGQGKDAGTLPDKDYVRLRTQSLKWLRDDLAAWRTVLEKYGDKARPTVAQLMQHWLSDKDFNGVRGPEALAKLPEAERRDWQKLWSEVADTLRRAAEKTPQPESADKKP